MIQIKSEEEIERMRVAGRITAGARALAVREAKAGMTTKELDKIIHGYIVKNGAKPSFLGYGGFPASACISINEQVIHGIPDNRVIVDGDAVKVDVGAYIGGFHGDCAETILIGDVDPAVSKLAEVTRQSFYEGLKFARAGCRLGDISNAIQTYVESFGYSVVTDFVGHGIGADLHEDPSVPNFGKAGHGVRLQKGMVLAIEPMINLGGSAVKVLANRWTVVTRDGKVSSHYENTVAITDGEPEVLTVAPEVL